MRTRTEIENDGKRPDILALEILLDMRDLLSKPVEKVKWRRPNSRKKKGRAVKEQTNGK